MPTFKLTVVLVVFALMTSCSSFTPAVNSVDGDEIDYSATMNCAEDCAIYILGFIGPIGGNRISVVEAAKKAQISKVEYYEYYGFNYVAFKKSCIKVYGNSSNSIKSDSESVAMASRQVEIKEEKPIERSLINSIGQEFLFIEPGTFMMGSPATEEGRDDGETQHRVTLTKGFYIQTTEVTQGQWKVVMGDNPTYFKDCGDDCPVENVSWNDCQEFIQKLNAKEGTNNYRLPTEAEWENACRAGTTGPYAGSFGSMTWYFNTSDKKTHPVAQKKPNAWGLYDMHGNVFEWCSDRHENYPFGSVTDPEGPENGSFRVFRGGSWSSVARYCRSAFRFYDYPSIDSSSIGFRLCLTQ